MTTCLIKERNDLLLIFSKAVTVGRKPESSVSVVLPESQILFSRDAVESKLRKAP